MTQTFGSSQKKEKRIALITTRFLNSTSFAAHSIEEWILKNMSTTIKF